MNWRVGIVPVTTGLYLILYGLAARTQRGLDRRNILAGFNARYGSRIIALGGALIAVGVVGILLLI